MVLQKAMKRGRNVHGIPSHDAFSDLTQHQGSVATLGGMPTPFWFRNGYWSRTVIRYPNVQYFER